MNATKTAVNRTFAVAIVMALMFCSFAAIIATEETEAAPYSSLEQTGTDVDQVYTLDISTGQSFTYPNIATNLDGFGTVSYAWTGSAADPSGTNGVKWDEASKTLSGVFTTAGSKTGVLTATWNSPDSTDLKQTATQTINFNISESIEIATTITGYTQVGWGTDDTALTVTFTGGSSNVAMTGGTSAGVPFTATMSGKTITVKPNTTITADHVTGSPYQLNVTVTNQDTQDSDTIEINLYVFEEIGITNSVTHFYTYEGDVASEIITNGINVTVNYEQDSNTETTVTDKGVVFNPTGGVISGDLASNNKLTVDATTGFTSAGDLTGGANSKDYTASVTVNGSIPAADGATGPTTSSHSVDFIVTVYKSLQFTSAPSVGNITVTNVGAGSSTVLLSSYVNGANSVVFEWGDGYKTSPMTTSEISANYTSTHTYAAPGTYLATIYATNDQGTTTSKAMITVGAEGDAGADTEEPVDEGKSFFDEHGWMFIVFIAASGLLVFAYFGPLNIQHPLVLIAAVICAILAVLTFFYVDFAGIGDAIGDLFGNNKE